MITILLLLLGYLVLIPAPGKRSGPVGGFIVGESSVQQIATILIKTPDGRSIKYVRTSSQWQIEEPYRVAASEPMIRELLEAVGKTRIMEIVKKDPETLSVYGLEEAQRIEVAFEFEDGTERMFRIGARLPLNQIYVYFQKEGESSVFRVWEGMRVALEKHAAVLAQGQPVQFNPAAIVSLELEQGGQFVHMEKRAENWFMARPVQRAANTAAVQKYLQSILALTSSGMYPFGAIPEKKLKSSDHFNLTLTQEGGKDPITIRLAPEDTLTPALLSIEQAGQSALYTTDSLFIDKLSLDPDEFYLAYALLFDTSGIANIEVLHPQFSFKLVRDSNSLWQFNQPYPGQRADSDSVDQLLHLLRNFPIEHYLEEETGVADTVDYGIVVKMSGNRDPAILEILKNIRGFYSGSSINHPSPFRLDSATVKRLEEFSPDALVDRHLFEFDPLKVEQVSVKRGENYYLLTKKGAAWELLKPRKKKARSAAAWKLIFGIRDLQYQKSVDENRKMDEDEDRCGLQESDIIIQLLYDGIDSNGEMRIQTTENGKEMTVSTSRFPGCYQVEAASVDQILQTVETLL